MAEEPSYVLITDLGPGDGGKGSTVHWAANIMSAGVIIKRGGAQGSHGVTNSRGESFNFSQWGCGTLEGIPTHLSEQFVVMPVGLANESEAITRTCGIADPYDLLTVDPKCICSTPYHRLASRITELAHKKNPRGTVGTGVGQAYRYSNSHPSLTIYASDLCMPTPLRAKLANVRDQIITDLKTVTDQEFLSDDEARLENDLDLLHDGDFFEYAVDLFHDVGKKLRFADLSDVIKKHPTAVIECSHGVLTDSVRGFHPHTSAIRTLPEFTQNMLRDAGYNGRIVNLGVHRAYEVRHGAGPMPTADPSLNATMPESSHKPANRWQGEVRFGALDIPLLNHAIGICNKTFPLDGICLTWFDQIQADGTWPICFKYKPGVEMTTEGLAHATPLTCNFQLPENPYKKAEIFRWCNDVLSNFIDLPLRLLSVGPTEMDKIFQ